MAADRLIRRRSDPRAYWDRAARERPAWSIATKHTRLDDAFFAGGAKDVDELLAHCGVQVTPADTLLELGCGAGRTTRRPAELAGTVVALDVSREMLQLAQQQVHAANVRFVLGSGHDLTELTDASVDIVFSDVRLQLVPTSSAQLSYLRETCRVLRPGGAAALQVRAPGLPAALLDLAGQAGRALQGKPTLAHEWRGARLREAQIRRALARPGIEWELITNRGARHRWVVLRRLG